MDAFEKENPAESTSGFSLCFDPANFSEEAIKRFRRIVLSWYAANGRKMPWRDTLDPWAILVSEVMLQQTQTERVKPKYLAWIERFPDAASLAASSLDEVLRLWSGLGYNRRALALVRASMDICSRFGGRLPSDELELRSLPGVGVYTAAAVAAFAFGIPSILIETNIRAVFLHHFFPESVKVTDRDLEVLVRASVDSDDPRSWYYALMDYGVEIKRRFGNPARKSIKHVRQSPFADSNRRLRGEILRCLSAAAMIPALELEKHVPFSGERVRVALLDLVAEGFVEYEGERVRLSRGIKKL